MSRLLVLAGICSLATAAARPAEAQSSGPLTAEAVVEAPAGAVWEALTTRDEIVAWQTGAAAGVELRIGAVWRTSYDPDSTLDDGTVIENEVLAFDPGRMLAMRTIRAPADFPFPRAILQTWSVLHVEPIDEMRTRVTVRMLGFSEDEESMKMRAFFEWGNAYELEKLQAHLAGGRR